MKVEQKTELKGTRVPGQEKVWKSCSVRRPRFLSSWRKSVQVALDGVVRGSAVGGGDCHEPWLALQGLKAGSV